MDGSQSLQGQRHTLIWFTESQLQLVIRNGLIPEWFHGIISRKMAEELLMPKPPGYFLIRVSESRIGYTLSYRAEDRCRHFMIDALVDGHYTIVGETRRHRFLQDLVDFHRRTPIMPFSDVLTVACGQSSNHEANYAELLSTKRHPKPDDRLRQNNSPQPYRGHSESQEDVTPPGLPYRPHNLINSTELAPSSQPKKLYPCLDEELPYNLLAPRYTSDDRPFNLPPEVPFPSCVPPPKQNQACIRTVSPKSAFTPTERSLSRNIHLQPVKNSVGKPSIVSNLESLMKRFQNKRSTSQEHIYTEINEEVPDRGENTVREYREITGEQAYHDAPYSCIYAHITPTDGVAPAEYRQPPPFAPGY